MMEVIPRTCAEALSGLDQGNDLARAGEVMQAVSIAVLCDRYEIDEGRNFESMERLMRYGADGTASVGEFVVLEIAAVLGISPGSAVRRVADVLNVRDRHPVLWEAVLAGRIRFFQAASMANDCVHLSAAQAAEVDGKCEQALPMWPWSRLLRELPGWIVAADPVGARAREAVARKERKVHVTGVKDGQVEVFARLSPADGIAFDQAITGIAASLPAQELPVEITDLALDQTDCQRIGLNHRRAVAMGQLARSAFGQDVLPVHELIVSIDAAQVPLTDETGSELTGVARVAKWGELLASRLPELLRGSKVMVRPVIDPTSLAPRDAHDPSGGMRLGLDVRDRYCMGPFGATPARSCDTDHTVAYRDGHSGQTRLSNLGNLSRSWHRGKTAGVVSVTQVRPGVFHWRTRWGYEFVVTAQGTTRIVTPPVVERLPVVASALIAGS